MRAMACSFARKSSPLAAQRPDIARLLPDRLAYQAVAADRRSVARRPTSILVSHMALAAPPSPHGPPLTLGRVVILVRDYDAALAFY